MTTFPSEDEWEAIERTIRKRMRLAVAARRIAIACAFLTFLFMLLYWCFCIHHMGQGKPNLWAEAIENSRRGMQTPCAEAN